MYELVIISKTAADQNEVHDMVSRVVKEDNGTVKNVDEWGDKEFTYPIKGHVAGTYCTYDVEIEGENIAELEQLVNFEDDILRSMIILKEE